MGIIKVATKVVGIRDIRGETAIQAFLDGLEIEDEEDLISIAQTPIGGEVLITVYYIKEDEEDEDEEDTK